MAIKSSKIILICVFCLFLMPQLGYCTDAIDSNIKIKAGYKLVETFYSCLASEIKKDICGKIFTNVTYPSKDDSDIIWKYLDTNKLLFLKNNESIKDSDYFKKTNKTVSFYNPPNLDKISSGHLYITLVHTLPGKFYSGIYKETSFPIVKDETSGEYKIDLLNIKINGIIINYGNEFVRDFDIIETIGFKSETIKAKPNLNP